MNYSRQSFTAQAQALLDLRVFHNKIHFFVPKLSNFNHQHKVAGACTFRRIAILSNA
jgi:hypothetical protein